MADLIMHSAALLPEPNTLETRWSDERMADGIIDHKLRYGLDDHPVIVQRP